MKKMTMLMLASGIVACFALSAQAQVLIGGNLNNGNMDSTYSQLIIDNAPPGPGPEDLNFPKPAVWINEGSRTIGGPYEDDLSSEPWSGPAPTPVTTGGSGLPGPDGCDGLDCGVFFKPFSGGGANGPATSHLYQDLPAIAGKTYTLTGWAGAESAALMVDAQMAVEFLDGGGSVIGGSVLSLLPTLTVDNGLAFDYKLYTVSALAPGGTAEVRARVSMIGATSNPAGGGQAFVVDDFTLTAVPEPTSLLLMGLGFVGAMGMRRRG